MCSSAGCRCSLRTRSRVAAQDAMVKHGQLPQPAPRAIYPPCLAPRRTPHPARAPRAASRAGRRRRLARARAARPRRSARPGASQRRARRFCRRLRPPLPAQRQPLRAFHRRGERAGVRGSTKRSPSLGPPLTLTLSPQAGRGDCRPSPRCATAAHRRATSPT
jgi:hypothetical protein